MRSDIQNLLRYGNRKVNPTHWCKKCNVPLIQERCESCNKKGIIITEGFLRPVFREELDIIRKQSKSRSKWLLLPDLSFWAARRHYFYNGEKVFTCGGLTNGKPFEIKFNKGKEVLLPKKPLKPETIVKRLKKANWSSLNKLEYQAIEFIEQSAKAFHGRLPVVSFSGGKDSCVVSHLVRLALGTKMIHIFGDTTIEYPDTYKFIEEFKENNPTVPFLTAKPSKTFFEFTDEIGPPSRILRWCCTTQKTGPIGQLKSSLSTKGSLAFIGSRRAESAKRSKYEVITVDNKMANEIATYPILTWSDTELWLYILSRDIAFNNSYCHGSTRVGCLYCPFNSEWSFFISRNRYKKELKKWESTLRKYAGISKIQDPDIFIDRGWRARAGGMGHNSYLTSAKKKECKVEENTIKYDLDAKLDGTLLEYFKPLGRILKYADNGTGTNFFILDPKTNEAQLTLRLDKNDNSIKITFLAEKNVRLLMQRVEKQVLKFQTCVLCGQCHNACKVGAFSPVNGRSYTINENICINCMECVKKDCIAQKSLKDYRK